VFDAYGVWTIFSSLESIGLFPLLEIVGNKQFYYLRFRFSELNSVTESTVHAASLTKIKLSIYQKSLISVTTFS